MAPPTAETLQMLAHDEGSVVVGAATIVAQLHQTFAAVAVSNDHAHHWLQRRRLLPKVLN